MRSGSTSRDRVLPRALGAALIAALPLAASEPRVVAQAITPSPYSMAGRDGVFRSTSELVLLPVTVTDAGGNFVTNLTRDDFAVFEDRVRQPVTLFATAAAPLDILLLLDTSSSMSERMPIAQQAAMTVIESLRPDDRASVGLFSDRVRIVQPLTDDKPALEQAIRGASARGTTALYQALYVGFREMAHWRRNAADVRRQAAIVLTDGDDTSSTHVSFDDVLSESRRAAVAVYTVFPGPSIPVPIISALARPDHAEFDLKELADESGGRAFRPMRVAELSSAYAQITQELAQQYWLGFVPPPHASGGFKTVSVQVVTHPELRTRTRRGYEASGPRMQTDASSVLRWR